MTLQHFVLSYEFSLSYLNLCVGELDCWVECRQIHRLQENSQILKVYGLVNHKDFTAVSNQSYEKVNFTVAKILILQSLKGSNIN